MVPLAVHVPEFREDSIIAFFRKVVTLGKDDVRVLDFLSSFFVFFFLHFRSSSSIAFSVISREMRELCKRERESERLSTLRLFLFLYLSVEGCF